MVLTQRTVTLQQHDSLITICRAFDQSYTKNLDVIPCLSIRTCHCSLTTRCENTVDSDGSARVLRNL